MKSEGAVSFYDYKNPISNANLLKIALQYCQNFDGLVQSFPLEKSVARNGQVHEDVQSTRLGLRGIPAFSEELQINRDLAILEYTGGKLHFPTVSTKNSVAMIRDAKKRGLNVSCSVAIFNLILNDSVLESFDSNYKLMPPLRSDEDIEALIEGLKDGTIDGVTSDHNPIDVERKKLEFEYAYFGSIGLESCFGALNKTVGVAHAVKALNRLKAIFEVPTHTLAEGQIADLTLFNPDKEWTFTKNDILSTSKNAALIDLKLKGKSYGIFANNQLILID
jgi:dihydroorotase